MRLFFINLGFLLLTCLLAACGQSKHETLANDAVILAFGDSLTAGVGTNLDNSYPKVLSDLSGRPVVNAGVSGETTAVGLQRFETELNRHSPGLVILLEGGNDILRNQSFGTSKNNLAAMIELAQARQIPLLLLGVPEKNLFSSSADFYEELADQYDLLFIEDLVSDLLRTSRYKSDTVHLNAEGYRAMAEAIYDYLRDQNLL